MILDMCAKGLLSPKSRERAAVGALLQKEPHAVLQVGSFLCSHSLIVPRGGLVCEIIQCNNAFCIAVADCLFSKGQLGKGVIELESRTDEN